MVKINFGVLRLKILITLIVAGFMLIGMLHTAYISWR